MPPRSLDKQRKTSPSPTAESYSSKIQGHSSVAPLRTFLPPDRVELGQLHRLVLISRGGPLLISVATRTLFFVASTSSTPRGPQSLASPRDPLAQTTPRAREPEDLIAIRRLFGQRDVGSKKGAARSHAFSWTSFTFPMLSLFSNKTSFEKQ